MQHLAAEVNASNESSVSIRNASCAIWSTGLDFTSSLLKDLMSSTIADSGQSINELLVSYNSINHSNKRTVDARNIYNAL